jgi:hypothetical protein
VIPETGEETMMIKNASKKRNKGRGGVREGAGRPPLPEGKAAVRFNLYLDRKTVAAARKIGKGNISLGVRIAVAARAGESNRSTSS